MFLTWAPVYGAALTLIFLGLSLAVVRLRRRHGALSGDGGQPDLARAIAAHRSFVDYAPLGLVMLALTEASTPPEPLLHGLGAALVLGRVVHAAGLAMGHLGLRQAGFGLTCAMLSTAAVVCATSGVRGALAASLG